MHILTLDSIITEDGAAIPRDLREPSYIAWIESVNPELSIQCITDHLQFFMDRLARGYGYDDLKTAITYRGDPNPKFAAEAEAFFLYRSAVWTTAYSLLAQVGAGTATLPTLTEVVALLPELTI